MKNILLLCYLINFLTTLITWKKFDLIVIQNKWLYYEKHKKKQIQMKKKYAIFINIINKLELEIIYYLKLANLEKNNKDE